MRFRQVRRSTTSPMRRCTTRLPTSCTWGTRRDITEQSFPQTQPLWFMGLAGTIPHTLVLQCGTDGLTPTVWELASPTARQQDGVSGSATVTGITLITIPGGAQWAITVAAGTRTTD